MWRAWWRCFSVVWILSGWDSEMASWELACKYWPYQTVNDKLNDHLVDRYILKRQGIVATVLQSKLKITMLTAEMFKKILKTFMWLTDSFSFTMAFSCKILIMTPSTSRRHLNEQWSLINVEKSFRFRIMLPTLLQSTYQLECHRGSLP